MGEMRLTEYLYLKYCLEGSPEGTSGGRFPICFLYNLWFYLLYISFMFYSSIKVIMEAVYKWFYFSSTASV